jgi:hypothetical protein
MTVPPTGITSVSSCWRGTGQWVRKYGVEFAEAFHYVGSATPAPASGRPARVEDYIRQNAVPIKP